jgi:ADYC domain
LKNKYRLAVIPVCVQLLGLVLLPDTGARNAAATTPDSIEIEGTEFKARITDGRVLRSAELVGTVISIRTNGGIVRLRIDAVERDSETSAAPLWLHSLSTPAVDGSWQPICSPAPDGRRLGFPLAGRSRADGIIEPAEPGAFEIVCTSGALGKCVRFGYLPWGDAAMRDIYNACIRTVRADYCGDGEGTTRNGMVIDLYDDHGVQKPANDPTQDFEAGWTAAGAVCVRHVRVRENISLETLAASCPRLRGNLGITCTEQHARELGAVLFIRSAR